MNLLRRTGYENEREREREKTLLLSLMDVEE